MKSTYGIFFIGVTTICMFYLAGRGARGQDFLDPNLVFENITFDMVNRGSYNISFCIQDLLNCWEIVKADSFCFRWRYYTSLCSLMKEFCAEFLNDQDEFLHPFMLQDSMCEQHPVWS